MRIYEKMGIDPTTKEGMEKLLGLGCDSIPDAIAKTITIGLLCPENGRGMSCSKCKAKRLFEEIPTKKVKRYETIESDEDLYNIVCDYICENSIPNNLKYIITGFEQYLTGQVEVEVEE